jgi:ribosome maturation factor RimP
MPTPSNLPFGEETKRLIAAAVEPLGIELCHIDWKPARSRGVLTLYIDRPQGVTIADCSAVSHAVLDLLEPVPEMSAIAYSLEVSSPGLDRPLWSLEDCRRFTGKRVTVRLVSKVEGTAKLKGLLEKVEGDALTVLDEDRARRYTVRFDDVQRARLIPEL